MAGGEWGVGCGSCGGSWGGNRCEIASEIGRKIADGLSNCGKTSGESRLKARYESGGLRLSLIINGFLCIGDNSFWSWAFFAEGNSCIFQINGSIVNQFDNVCQSWFIP